MLTNFEELTEDLNSFEIDTVLPIIVDGFSQKAVRGQKGKEYAVHNGRICKVVNIRLEKAGHKYRLTGVKLRKFMSVIRLHGLLQIVCSSSKGYYLAKNTKEVQDCIDSLEQRIRQQRRVVDALKDQLIINRVNLNSNQKRNEK